VGLALDEQARGRARPRAIAHAERDQRLFEQGVVPEQGLGVVAPHAAELGARAPAIAQGIAVDLGDAKARLCERRALVAPGDAGRLTLGEQRLEVREGASRSVERALELCRVEQRLIPIAALGIRKAARELEV